MRHFITSIFVFLILEISTQFTYCQQSSIIHEPYLLDTNIVSRSITAENPTGMPGQGGKASSNLGIGRKGSPRRMIKSGESVVLADISGPGIVRHIWMTTHKTPVNLRSLVIRVWYEDQSYPSIECPIGDFFGFAFGKVQAYQSAVHSVGENAGMNIWLPMPFTKRFKMTVTNDGKKDQPLYYQIDYTLHDSLPSDVGRLHVAFQRENPTVEKHDFVIMPKRTGKGRYIGAVIGVRRLSKGWWGEGEMKVYMDGDSTFPTICGTGSEDYVGLSYGMQQTPFLYNGCSLKQGDYVSMYRWHLLDPIQWKHECRITIQQIGYKNGLYERQDDWSAASFWYEPIPSDPLPPMPNEEERTADLPKE